MKSSRKKEEMLTNNIKTIRLQRRLKQKELADLIGVSPSQMHKYENGHVPLTVQVVMDLAGALKVRPSQLIPELTGRGKK